MSLEVCLLDGGRAAAVVATGHCAGPRIWGRFAFDHSRTTPSCLGSWERIIRRPIKKTCSNEQLLDRTKRRLQVYYIFLRCLRVHGVYSSRESRKRKGGAGAPPDEMPAICWKQDAYSAASSSASPSCRMSSSSRSSASWAAETSSCTFWAASSSSGESWMLR